MAITNSPKPIAIGKKRPFIYFLTPSGNIFSVQSNHSIEQLGEWFSMLPKCDGEDEVRNMYMSAAITSNIVEVL